MRAWYALGVLTLVLFLSYVDRFVLAILVEPIKSDLGLSDSQLGLLTGFAFAAVYGTVGVPIARLADKGSRRNVVALALTVWSLATAACGLVQNFWQMLVTRIAVGGGEAGGTPASHAMIADLFPLHRRATALAIISAGGQMGLMAAFAGGAYLEKFFGWRGAFVAVAAPGLLLALVLRLTVREPGRGRYSDPVADQLEVSPSALRDLWKNRGFRQMFFAFGASVLLLFGQSQWTPAFLERSFGAARTDLGVMLAATQGLASLVGTLSGGVISDWLTRRSALWPMRVVIITTVLAFIPQLGVYIAPNVDVAYLMSALGGFFASFNSGPLLAVVQTIVHPSRRALASALTMFSAAVIGMGGGPFVVGALSDLLTPILHAEALRWSLFAMTLVVTPWSLIHFALVQREVARAQVKG